MRLAIKSLLISIFIITLVSCSSQKLIVKRNTVPTINDTLTYSDYVSALLCANIDTAKFYAANDDEKFNLAIGTEHLINGRFADAETTFDNLYKKHIKDEPIRLICANFLANTIIYQSEWQKYYNTFKQDSETQAAAYERMQYPYFINYNHSYSFTKDIDTIPIDIYHGLITVKLNINGTLANMLFDTGCEMTVLSDDLAKKLNISTVSDNTGKMKASTNQIVNSSPGVLPGATLGNFKITNLPIYIMQSSFLKAKFLFITFMKFDGIVGYDVIKHFDCSIDVPNKRIIIRKPHKKENIVRNFFWNKVPIIKLKSANKFDLLFFFDSGSNYSSLFQMITRKLKIDKMHEKKRIIWGVGGSIKQQISRVDQISIFLKDSELNFENIDMRTDDRDAIFALDGTLGIDVAAHNIIHLDPLNGIFELE